MGFLRGFLMGNRWRFYSIGPFFFMFLILFCGFINPPIVLNTTKTGMISNLPIHIKKIKVNFKGIGNPPKTMPVLNPLLLCNEMMSNNAVNGS